MYWYGTNEFDRTSDYYNEADFLLVVSFPES